MNNKHIKLNTLCNIPGFIVNIYDPISFDIDLRIPEELQEKYQSAISSEYEYVDITSDKIERNDYSNLTLKQGKTYRCRLRGVAKDKSNKNLFYKTVHELYKTINELKNRNNSKVICTISNIDKYSWLLVDIYINTSTGKINFTNYLLNSEKNVAVPVYYLYNERTSKTARC